MHQIMVYNVVSSHPAGVGVRLNFQFCVWAMMQQYRDLNLIPFLKFVTSLHDNIHTLDRQQAYKKDNTCDTVGRTTLTSVRNVSNMKTLMAVVRKARQFPRISMQLMSRPKHVVQ
jgi:hypothetical protein